MNERAPLHRIDSDSRRRVSERLRDILATQPRVAFAFVFGSFTEDRPFRDIDVGVQIGDHPHGHPPPSDNALAALEERLARAAGFPVDLVVLNERPVTFLFHVYRGQLVFSRSDEQVTEALERTMREYFDMAPVLRQATREAFGT